MIYEPFEGESDNSFWGVGTANYGKRKTKQKDSILDSEWKTSNHYEKKFCNNQS